MAKKGWFMETAKTGFALSFGSVALFIILILVAFGLMIGGFILVKKESKKPKEKRNMTNMIIGFVLMGLGVVVGLGFGAPIFFELLGDAI